MHCCTILLDRSQNVEEHPCHSLLPFEFGAEGVEVQILTCSMIDEGTGYSMIKIKDESDSFPDGFHKSENGECTVTKVGTGQYLAMVVNRRCFLSKLINRAGCFLASAVPKTETMIEWKLVGPNSTQIHKLLAEMRANGYTLKLVASESLAMKSTLTLRQEACFNMAMDLGYYDVPKRIGLDELSTIMGCSKSTLNVTLRTAEKKIFDFYRLLGESKRFL